VAESAVPTGTTPEPITFEADTFSALGTPRPAVRLPGEVFDGTVNIPVMHQAVKAYLANQRQGNAATKIRKYVTGGNQKPWKQKGTGRARQGSIRAPHWVGGGTVFGPTPRSYAQYVPRQVRALARKSALNARAREGAVKVIDAFRYEAPSTRRLVQLLAALGVAEKKVLILTDGAKANVHLSARNLPAVHALPYTDVSTYHVLWSDVVLVEAAAIGQELEPLAESAPAAPSRVRRPATSGGRPKAAAGREAESPDAERTASAARKTKRGAAKAEKQAAPVKAAKKSPPTGAAKKRAAAKKPAPTKKKGR
jgi:large subunit ribosomal protein L4